MQIWSTEIKEIETLYTSIKGRFPELDKELDRLIKTDDENIVLIYSRRCLEVIITDLCECELKQPRKTEPLKGIIDKLNREEKVPSNIIVSMQYLNSLSTFGAHPKEFDPEQVKPVLNNLATIIKWYQKYKMANSRQEIVEAKHEEKKPEDSTKYTRKPKKRLMITLSGLLLVCVIVIGALIVFQIFNIRSKSGNLPNDVKSIAVLSFVNISGNSEQEYFVDGITETLIIELSRIAALKVITIRNTDRALPIYREDKNIDAILEGTALLVGDRVRVTSKLINLSTEETLWANSYDYELYDVFKLHSDVVNKITHEINVYLTREEELYLSRYRRVDPEVYKLYLRGRYHLGKRTEENFLNAIQYFEEVVNKDPQNAYAYSGLADAYTLLCEYGLISAEEAYPKAKAAATKAFEIDDRIAETHTSLAYIKLLLEWDWKGAEESFKKAIQINSNYATAHQWYSFYLILQNRVEESIQEQQLALELDPLSAIINKGFGHRYLNARQYEKTIESQLQTLEIEPEFAPSYLEMGYAYLELGKCEDAMKSFQEAKNISGGLIGLTAPTIGYGYAKCGKRKEALEILDQYRELAKETFINPYFFAVIYSGLGEWEKSFEWLEKSYQLRSPTLVYLKVNPVWDPIRSDPRFIVLCSKIWPDDY